MSFDIWKPLYVDNFNFDKYLYHYTSIESAIKIICSNSLLFSQMSKTNDPSESKMKITFGQESVSAAEADCYKEKREKISEYFALSTSIVQLFCFCFCTDTKISISAKQKYLSSMSQKDTYYDVSGRGFALPRMWAQYAGNHKGVCFIFNREKLENLVRRKIAFVKCAPVKYKKFFDRYIIDSKRMDDLYEKITKLSNGTLTLLDLLQHDRNFLAYNFFEKMDDWENEHEYRIITLIDKKDTPNFRLRVEGVKSFLEGIVIGENMDPAYSQVIELLTKSFKSGCSVKRIQFGSRICKVT